MAEQLSGGESRAAISTRDPQEVSSRERDLFAQYGPCPSCGEETVTYSKAFEESDLTCYTCGHWLDYHEATAHGAVDPGGERQRHGGLWARLRSLF